MAEALTRGYATASTDTGHTGDSGSTFLHIGRSWWITPIVRERDDDRCQGDRDCIPWRCAEAVVLNGCSLGGRQGLMEAQRFPADYGGIIVGAPANLQTRLSV